MINSRVLLIFATAFAFTADLCLAEEGPSPTPEPTKAPYDDSQVFLAALDMVDKFIEGTVIPNREIIQGGTRLVLRLRAFKAKVKPVKLKLVEDKEGKLAFIYVSRKAEKSLRLFKDTMIDVTLYKYTPTKESVDLDDGPTLIKFAKKSLPKYSSNIVVSTPLILLSDFDEDWMPIAEAKKKFKDLNDGCKKLLVFRDHVVPILEDKIFDDIRKYIFEVKSKRTALTGYIQGLVSGGQLTAEHGAVLINRINAQAADFN
jgi:hypothetical protein